MKNCIAVPEILLPKASVDMTKWAVIACDQHTSDAAYWQELENYVGAEPSTLRLTLPEIYLQKDNSQRIQQISAAMRSYKKEGVFRKLPKGFIAVERRTPYSESRRGIVLAVDLEDYSYEKKSGALIRATEATILERIPPRLKIRENADIEFSHIMLLYDDPHDSVWSSIQTERTETVYDFDLNMNGGHITGKFISETEGVLTAFGRLIRDRLLFMVGDGNHSLATAKASWDHIKSSLTDEEKISHPARFALCEAVNIYDEGIRFEAIHRLVKGVDAKLFRQGLKLNGRGSGFLVCAGKKFPISLEEDIPSAVASVDAYIERFIAEHGGEVDYIHGEESLLRLTEEKADRVGILLPKMDKSDLFPLVKKYGSLPRKTFSMGESEEKRYYVEGKEIR